MRNRLPLLLCLSLFAPVCVAQSNHEDIVGTPETPAEPDDAPRSAFGKVMGVMIEALRQDALRDADPTSRADAPIADAEAPLDIEVGSAFRLQPEVTVERPAESAGPPCSVQPCERKPVTNLRIASQK